MERGRSPGAPRTFNGEARVPLSDVKKGAAVDGIVKDVSTRRGVLVDFGAQYSGVLQVRADCVQSYTKGMKLNAMTVTSCNPDAGKVWLRPDPDTMPGPAPRSLSPPASSRSESRSRSTWRRRGRSRTRSTASGSRSRGRSANRRRSQTRGRRDWDHSDGKQLETIQTGTVVDGEVTGANKFGVFVNFGAVKDGRLSLPQRFAFEFRIGDYVDNMRVEKIDLSMQRVTLTLLDLDRTLQNLMHERVPLEELEEGMRVDGIISNAGPQGVFVHIGAARDGKLRVPRRVQVCMLAGERVKGLRIEAIDLAKQRLSLVFEDVDSASPSESPPPAEVVTPRRTPRTRSKSAGRRQPPAVEAPPLEDECIALKDIQVGEMANGVVMSINDGGAMVDIGAEVLGMLDLPADLRQRFQVSDMVEGMVVEEVDVKLREIRLSMDDPELAVLDNHQPMLPIENRPMMSLENGAVRLEQLEPPVPIRQTKTKGKTKAARDKRSRPT